MQQRFFQLAILAITILTFTNSCTKLDTTTQGSDLVTVDNINTFSQSFDVITTQGVFTNDSTLVNKTDNHVIGLLNSVPNVGKTDARLYLQLKPSFYPFYFGNAGDTVRGISTAGLDSVVLCLSYRGVWGDSSSAAQPQNFVVKTFVNSLFKSKTDTLFGLAYSPTNLTSGTIVGSKTITPKIVAQKVYYGKASAKDSVENQIRIKLDASFANFMFNTQDSTSLGPNNAYYNDSIFRERFNGFEISSTIAGNSLYYVNLADIKTRLEFHYHKTKAGVKDTVMTPFYFISAATLAGNPASSSCNYVSRNYSGFPRLSSPSNLPVTDYIDIQNAPGTFASIKIPGLTAWRNTKDKIIHRAYLMVDQNDASTPSVYTAPSYMYLDLKDSVLANRYKPVYFDLSTQLNYNPDVSDLSALFHPYPNSNVEIANFGGKELKRTEAGETFSRYEINVTRYVQHIVSNNYYNYDMRLYAPFNYYYGQYLRQYVIPYYNQLAYGSVRIGAGTTANVPHKMKLVVIYSKVKV